MLRQRHHKPHKRQTVGPCIQYIYIGPCGPCLTCRGWASWHSSQYGGLSVKKEMKCSGDFEILHEIVRDNTQKSENHELILLLSRTILCSTRISESLLQFIPFLTVYSLLCCVHTVRKVIAGFRCMWLIDANANVIVTFSQKREIVKNLSTFSLELTASVKFSNSVSSIIPQ